MNKEQNSHPDHMPNVKCEVVNCMYNEKRSHCMAKEVKIGPTFAAMTGDTICRTFKPK